MKLLILVMTGLALAGCGQLGFNGGTNNTSQSIDPSQQTALTALASIARSGEIDLHFDLVDAVDGFLIPFVEPAAILPGASATSPKLVIVRGVGDLSNADANGNLTGSPVFLLPATAIFSGDTATGAACMDQALKALDNKLQMEIRGQGHVFQIGNGCPPNAMCVSPPPSATDIDSATAVASQASSIVSNPPIPAPWFHPQVSVFYSTIDFCLAADPTVTPPPSPVAQPL